MDSFTANDKMRIDLAKLLALRLERLSVDSHWAHQASGLRGSLLKCLENIDKKPDERTLEQLDLLLEQGFSILEKAASVL